MRDAAGAGARGSTSASSSVTSRTFAAKRCGALGPVGVVAQHVPVVLHRRAAAGRVDHDGLVALERRDGGRRAPRAPASSPACSCSAPQQRGTRGACTSKPSAASTRAVASFTSREEHALHAALEQRDRAARSPRAAKRSGRRRSGSRAEASGESAASAARRGARRRSRGRAARSVRPRRCASATRRERAQPPGMGEEREDEPAEGALADAGAPVALDLRARVLDQLVVLHARTGRRSRRPCSPGSCRCARPAAPTAPRGPASSARSARAASPSPRPRAGRWGRWAGRSRSARSRRSGRAAAARMSSNALTSSTPGAHTPAGRSASLTRRMSASTAASRAPHGSTAAHLGGRVEHHGARQRLPERVHGLRRRRTGPRSRSQESPSGARPTSRREWRVGRRKELRQVGLHPDTRTTVSGSPARARCAGALGGPDRSSSSTRSASSPRSRRSWPRSRPAGRGAAPPKRASTAARAALPAHVEARCARAARG